MNRVNVIFTAVIGVLFALLMVFAGQPITPEAELVQRWYDAFCNPALDQSLLYDLTWHGDLSDAQLKAAIDASRVMNNYALGCTATVNHNIIYFQWIPPELRGSFKRIKFVAVNVYPLGAEQTPNHVLSVRSGVHVLYDSSGHASILPRFIANSPLGLHTTAEPVQLYNNDGLLMGEARINGPLMTSQQNGVEHIGIPISLSASRAWGSYWIRVYADGVEVVPDYYADVLRPDLQAGFLSAMGENFPIGSVISGVLWFTPPHPPTDIRVSVDAYQTLWDLRALPTTFKVSIMFTLNQ
ncbi:MAG: hypothetical protein LCI00_00085 [Chloroflexi bacterium]|nr:hypothetical protein [Chloroflexota bacterium]MCC6893183.1 hypothetical protein [Anaerolineae bacterium]